MQQEIGSWTLQADQMQVLNPLLILIFIPLCQIVSLQFYIIYMFYIAKSISL